MREKTTTLSNVMFRAGARQATPKYGRTRTHDDIVARYTHRALIGTTNGGTKYSVREHM